jgi:hypothetical protein
MGLSVCLTTVCIGDSYLKQYDSLFRSSQEAYAKKCGYDFQVITDYISEPRHPHLVSFNKVLVCNYNENKNYDYIIFIDADILINPNTPPIHTAYDFGDKIGVVNQSQPTLEARLLCQKKKGFEVTAKEYYKLKSNHDIDTDHIINTGLLVIQPRKHKEFLQSIFDKYSFTQINHKSGFHYEQSCIGYEIQKNNLFLFMDMKWNALWGNNKYYYNMLIPSMKKNATIKNLCLQDFFNSNYFIHLAGQCDYHLIHTLDL